MPRDARTLIFVGIKNAVVALDSRTGEEVWRAKLKGSDFVTVLWDGENLVAANYGEVFGLDWKSGAITWHNQMKGLGYGLVSLASSRLGDLTSGAIAQSAKKTRDNQATVSVVT